MLIKKTICLILLMFTAGCAADQPAEVDQTATITSSSESLVVPSSSPTLASSPTIPVITTTQTPLERIAFTAETDCQYVCDTIISFVYNDGTDLQSSTLLEPFYNSQGYLAWSPDGRFLAFDGADTIMGCGIPGTDCVTSNYGTYVADYSQNVILQHIEGTLANSSWSPDSQSLVLSIRENTEDRNSIGDLYVLDVNKGELIQLTNAPSSDLYPSWSPDGQWIAFVRFDPAIPGCNPLPWINPDDERCNQASLYRIRPDGSDLQLLIEPIFIYNKDSWMGFINNAPVWSPDGMWLAFLRKNEAGFNDQSDISIINVETGEWQLAVRAVGFEGAITPAWSPVGQKLAFALYHNGNYDIFLWDMKENSIVNLTETPSHEYAPVWSLSGAHIAFISGLDLVIMTADGTEITLIEYEDRGVLGYPAWQPGVQP